MREKEERGRDLIWLLIVDNCDYPITTDWQVGPLAWGNISLDAEVAQIAANETWKKFWLKTITHSCNVIDGEIARVLFEVASNPQNIVRVGAGHHYIVNETMKRRFFQMKKYPLRFLIKNLPKMFRIYKPIFTKKIPDYYLPQ